MYSIFRLSAVSALVVTVALGPGPVRAYAAENAQSIVDKATLSVQDIFSSSSQQTTLTGNLSSARAVMVCPSMFRVSIGFGGAHGDCVLLARDARGSWSDPAFYKLSSASMGIQFGVQSSQIIFFVMTDRGLQALLDSQFQFDSNAGASFANMSSATASGTAGARNTDILIAQKSQGVFAGVSLGGSKLTVNSDVNRDYYKQSVGPEDILVSMRVNNPDADPLRRVLMRYAQTTPAAAQNTSRYTHQAAPRTTYSGDATGDSVGASAPSDGIRQENLGPVSR
ncbi:MAG: lipid-binding SYLF domain-containing protein [Acetobacter sp.]